MAKKRKQKAMDNMANTVNDGIEAAADMTQNAVNAASDAMQTMASRTRKAAKSAADAMTGQNSGQQQ